MRASRPVLWGAVNVISLTYCGESSSSTPASTSPSTAALAAGAIAAGCDIVLDCWGRMDEMIEIAGRLGEIAPDARDRLDRAMASRAAPEGDLAALIAKRDALLALV